MGSEQRWPLPRQVNLDARQQGKDRSPTMLVRGTGIDLLAEFWRFWTGGPTFKLRLGFERRCAISRTFALSMEGAKKQCEVRGRYCRYVWRRRSQRRAMILAIDRISRLSRTSTAPKPSFSMGERSDPGFEPHSRSWHWTLEHGACASGRVGNWKAHGADGQHTSTAHRVLLEVDTSSTSSTLG